MAWGYWSATTVSDRGRSPRRNQNGSTNQTIPVTVEDRPQNATYATTSVNSNNNTQTLEFENNPPSNFTRRPSLDLGTMGPQGTLAGILCAAHGSRQNSGTLSAGNTLTRVGSRHAAVNVEYAVPHHMHHHHHAAYVEYHQTQLSFSDDDSSSEPGYATGIRPFFVLIRFVL